jgi:hypothetical protein
LSIIGFPLIGIYLYGTNAFETSVITVLTFLPNLLLGSHIGVFVDNHKKKFILVITNMLCFLILASLYILSLTNYLHIIGFYAGIFLLSSLMIFSSLAFYSQVPLTVKPANVQAANYRLEISNSIIQTAGPSVGGFIIQLFSAPFVLILDALSFLLSGFIQLFITDQEAELGKNLKKEKRYLEQIKESYVFVFSHEILSPIAKSYFIVVMAIGLFQSLQIYYLGKVLNLKASMLGFILSLGNVGLVIGSFFSAYISRKIGNGKAVIFSLSLYAFGFLIYALSTSETIYLIVLGQIVISVAPPVYNLNVLTMRQKLVEPDMLARASAIWRVFGRGFVPLGALIGGVLAQTLTVRSALFAASLIGFLGLWPIVKSAKLKNYIDR